MLVRIPKGLDEIIATYGDASHPDFSKDYIVTIPLPYVLYYNGKETHHIQIHRLLVDNITQALIEIQKAGLDSACKNYGGTYNYRPIRGQNAHLSTHSWGIAIDLEPAEYPLGSTKRWPVEITDIFFKYGFMCGQDFKSRKDPMHFQACTKY